jgi:hypothetical protein
VKDTVSLSKIGSSVGFVLAGVTLDYLGLDVDDPVEIQIVKVFRSGEPTEVNIPMMRKIIKVGGSSRGIIIKKNIIDELNLEAGMNIIIEINKKS